MTTKKRFERSLSASKRASKRKLSPLARDIIKGLEQGIAHFRGEKKLRRTTYYIPDLVDVSALRRKLGLSQTQFAIRFGFNPRTLQEWEQGRAEPDIAVRAYLTVISRAPDAVRAALTGR